MAKFRKKPVIIEAWQSTPTDLWPEWVEAAVTHIEPGNVLVIATLEGAMRAQPGDWIIQGVKGEVYPCRDDIFRATYDPV